MSSASPYGDAERSAKAVPCRADVLICSGLDPSGGAGFLADARAIERLGARPCGVVTALTVQSTTGASASHPVDAEVLGEQLTAILGDIQIGAVKLGWLGSPQIVDAINHALDMTAAPVVWDPVAGPSLGSFDGPPMLAPALAILGRHLTLLTPNIPELAALVGGPIETIEDAAKAGQALARRAGCAIFVKGGHLVTPRGFAPPHPDDSLRSSIDRSIDLLCTADAVDELSGPRIAGGEHIHGTGCALSSAIAAHLARGATLPDACRAAKIFVADLIAAPARPGRGAAAVL